jgi:hypothetical protein
MDVLIHKERCTGSGRQNDRCWLWQKIADTRNNEKAGYNDKIYFQRKMII